jgi:hypothetical protein
MVGGPVTEGVQESQIAELETAYAKAHAIRGRSLRWLSICIGLLTGLYLLLAVTGGGKWYWRDIALVLGQGSMAVGTMALCWRLDQQLQSEEQDNLRWLREIARRDAILAEMRPVMEHITEAHARGAAALFPPPESGPEQPRKLH